MKIFEYENVVYYISSFSGAGHSCVGVSIQHNLVKIISTNDTTQKANFTLDEWEAFIRGVKAGEFDLTLP